MSIEIHTTDGNESFSSGLENLISSLQSFSKSLNASFQAHEAFSSLQVIQQSLSETVNAILQAQYGSEALLNNVYLSAAAIGSELFKGIQVQLRDALPSFEAFADSFGRLPERLQAALITLANHGWFLDPNMPLPFLWELEAALNDGNVENAELALTDYFREHLPTIENRIIEKYPNRAKIVHSAINAHKREEYELSIPVFLSQSDGVCYEVVKQYFFLKENKKPRTSIYVDSIAANSFRHALLSPLSQPLPISASWKEREPTSDELNRHQVFHGESLDYGTELNSLKAISLLNYIAHVLRWDDDTNT